MKAFFFVLVCLTQAAHAGINPSWYGKFDLVAREEGSTGHIACEQTIQTIAPVAPHENTIGFYGIMVDRRASAGPVWFSGINESPIFTCEASFQCDEVRTKLKIQDDKQTLLHEIRECGWNPFGRCFGAFQVQSRATLAGNLMKVDAWDSGTLVGTCVYRFRN